MLRFVRVPGQKFFVDHRIRPLRDRLRDELPAVRFFARIGDKGIALPHRAAVGNQVRDGHFELVQLFERKHQTSSLTMSTGGAMTLSSGASFGTLSVRNASPVTLPNTGAATSPP